MRSLGRLFILCAIATTLQADEKVCPTLREREERLSAPQAPAEIVELYQALVVMPRDAQRELLLQFKPALKRLRQFEQRHSGMDAVQKAVIAES